MSKSKLEIPPVILDAAMKAYLDNLLPEKFKADFDGENHTHRFRAYAQKVASLMLEAAGVPEMAAERERIGMALFQNGYDSGWTTDSAVEAIEAMAARITGLEAGLAKHQESQFHPDWSQLKTTRKSLREAWARIRELEAELVKVREVLHQQTSYLEGRLRNALTGEGCPHGYVRPSQCVDCIKERG